MINLKIMAKTLTIPQREELKNRISELYFRGYGIGRMAAEISRTADFTVSHVTVGNHLRQILKANFESREKDIELRINTELLRLNEVEYEAWQAWKRSCTAKKKTISKNRGTPGTNSKGEKIIKANSISNTEQVEDSVGDPRFLDIIAKCIEARLQWITKGMDEAERPNNGVNITNNTVLIMAQQDKYIPEKLRQINASVVTGVPLAGK